MTQPELRQLAHAARRELIYLEQSDPIGVIADRTRVEDQIRAVLAPGWRPPAAPVSTVDELVEQRWRGRGCTGREVPLPADRGRCRLCV